MGKADSEKEGQWERRKVWKRPVGKKVSGNCIRRGSGKEEQ